MYIGVMRGSQILLAPATKFGTVAPNIFSIIIAVCHVCIKICISSRVAEQKALDNSEVHGSL
jgi:hypothetical protein